MTAEGRPESRISRRRMLKRLGAGAAIAWSAPVLSSLRTPAFAQGYPRACEDCETNPCGFDPVAECGTSPTGGTCVCGLLVTGGCECFQPICLPTPELCDLTDPTCPVGFACINVACCGFTFCAPLCGTILPARTTSRARRWA
jgi:hypothetical protein